MPQEHLIGLAITAGLHLTIHPLILIEPCLISNAFFSIVDELDVSHE